MNAQSETHHIGLGMIVAAVIIMLGLLSYLFQSQLDQQFNPNSTIQTIHNNQSFIEIKLKQNRSGHYVATGTINDHVSVFLLDTGATYVAIPDKIAQRLNLSKGRPIKLSTANGISTGYKTTIKKLTLGDISLFNIKAIITPNLSEILLGMSALKQLEFTQRGDKLSIRQYL